MKVVIIAGHEGGSCNVAMLSALVWPAAIASFGMAAARCGIPAHLSTPFIPNRLGCNFCLPAAMASLAVAGWCYGVPALEYYF